ncbi:hypothetical protein N3K66_000108 [Trichothecium roseum]|uniref:Uncharacterized protein n=1 Tax=Trichothecium roseum TaxID=47278 RepID=A0ACC0VB06_9HYPO|nr:hypothetical protein N3K66_000108 [Trichothecium roseum]
MAPILDVRAASKADVAALVTGACIAIGVLVIAGVFFLCYRYRLTLISLSRDVEKDKMSAMDRRRRGKPAGTLPVTVAPPSGRQRGILHESKSKESFSSEPSQPPGDDDYGDDDAVAGKCPGPSIPISQFYIPPPDIDIGWLDDGKHRTHSKPLPDPAAAHPFPPDESRPHNALVHFQQQQQYPQYQYQQQQQQHTPKASQASLPRFMATIPEERTLSDTSGLIPLRLCRTATSSWASDRRQPSVDTLSTLGMELLRDTMQEPRPAHFYGGIPLPPPPPPPQVPVPAPPPPHPPRHPPDRHGSDSGRPQGRRRPGMTCELAEDLLFSPGARKGLVW